MTNSESTAQMKVAKTTDPVRLAGAIAHRVREEGSCTVGSIGLVAGQIAEQAVEEASAYLKAEGVEVEIERSQEQLAQGPDGSAPKLGAYVRSLISVTAAGPSAVTEN